MKRFIEHMGVLLAVTVAFFAGCGDDRSTPAKASTSPEVETNRITTDIGRTISHFCDGRNRVYILYGYNEYSISAVYDPRC